MNRQNSSRAEYTRSTPTALVIAGSVILLIASLYWAQAILIPVALAMLLAFMLAPGVTAMQQIGLGRIPSAILIVVLTFLVLATVGWAVSSEIMSLAGELPKYQDNIKQKIHDLRGVGKGSALEKVQDTFDEVKSELEKEDKSRKLQKQPRSVIVQPESSWRLPFNFGPLAEGLASVGLVVALLIFMLVQREELRNRLIRLVGYSKLTVTTKALEEAAQRISRYLLMQTLINSFFGFTVAIALFLIDLPYAFLWGFLAALSRFVPYVGVWIAAAMPTALSLAVFREWGWPLAVIGIFVVLELII
ncbi:MAG TPA: AI-2E family transporter, partial [Candidatus Binatia bacterium]|nr:AI-2E family transporter [Candidatus Binatia bacterium]